MNKNNTRRRVKEQEVGNTKKKNKTYSNKQEYVSEQDKDQDQEVRIKIRRIISVRSMMSKKNEIRNNSDKKEHKNELLVQIRITLRIIIRSRK